MRVTTYPSEPNLTFAQRNRDLFQPVLKSGKQAGRRIIRGGGTEAERALTWLDRVTNMSKGNSQNYSRIANGTVIRYSSNESAIRAVDSVYRVQGNETARLSVPPLFIALFLVFFFFFHCEKNIVEHPSFSTNDLSRLDEITGRARVSICAIYRAKFFIDDNELRAQFWRIVECFICRANNSIR